MSNVIGELVKSVFIKATSSIPAVITVEAVGNFSERVRQFIVYCLASRHPTSNLAKSWWS